MPSINENQKVLLQDSFLESSASGDYQKVDLKGMDKVLMKYGNDFKDNLVASIKYHNVTSSGNMQSDENLYFKLIDDKGKKSLEIYIVTYAKFVDKGVKGWGSSKNAPSSPYSYSRPDKTNSDGKFQESIRKYIQSGTAKVQVSDIKKYGAVGGEKKHLSLIDQKVNKLVFLIKKYGIKTTNFYSEAVEKTFKGLEQKIADEFAVNISIQLTK